MVKSHWVEIIVVVLDWREWLEAFNRISSRQGEWQGVVGRNGWQGTARNGLTCVHRTVNITNVYKYYLRMSIIKDTSAIIFIAMYAFRYPMERSCQYPLN